MILYSFYRHTSQRKGPTDFVNAPQQVLTILIGQNVCKGKQRKDVSQELGIVRGKEESISFYLLFCLVSMSSLMEGSFNLLEMTMSVATANGKPEMATNKNVAHNPCI